MRRLVGLAAAFLVSTAMAAQVEISINKVAALGAGEKLGTITAIQTDYGVIFKPNLKGFSSNPSVRGFHVHVGKSCDNYGLAALGHFDPQSTEKHLGPYNKQGHQGDIQSLMINKDGTATLPVLAPKLKLQDLAGHTLVIHAHGDNYSDKPEALGGGGDRVACGIIPAKINGASKVSAKPAAKPTAKPASATKPKPATKPVAEPAAEPAAKPAAVKPAAVKQQSDNDKIQQLIQRKQQLQALQAKTQKALKNMQGEQ